MGAFRSETHRTVKTALKNNETDVGVWVFRTSSTTTSQ